jgi:ligand-binding sensor domain-containing protein
MRRVSAGRTRPAAAAGALAAAAIAGAFGLVHARQQRLWTPESRVLVTAGGEIAALAVSPSEVFAATRQGILVFDPLRSAWRLPLGPPDVRAASITALAFDGVGGELWIGTAGGGILRGPPGFRTWESVVAGVHGGIDAILPDPGDASVWILSRGEWWRAASSSALAESVPAARVPAPIREEALRGPDDPYLAAARGSLGLDPQLRRWPITDIARGLEPDEFWIATGGGGLVRYNRRRAARDWLRFGLVAPGAASVAFAGRHLWFGGDGRGRQNGVAAALPDLTTWQQFDATQGAPSGFVAEIAFDGERLWFAAEDGLYRLVVRDAGSRRAWRRLTTADGLPSERVRAVLHDDGRIWAGTDRGAVAFDTAGRKIAGPLLPGGRVARIARIGDGLWLAGDEGLRTLSPRAPAPLPGVPPGLPAVLANGRVLDVAGVAGTWILAEAGLYHLDDSGLRGPIRAAALGRIGSPIRLSADAERLWVAAAGGIAHLDPVSGVWETFTVPGDIPWGPVLDVLPMGEDVWVGTPGGAVRLRWR